MSPITLGQFQVRYSNIPGNDKAIQPLDVWYYAGYVQDEWRPGGNVTVTGGVRFDVANFKETSFANPAADALTFRDEDGSPVQFQTGLMPDAEGAVVAAHRHQLGRGGQPADSGPRRHRRLHR